MEYTIVVQQCRMVALFDTDDNISVISQKLFKSLPLKPKMLMSNAYTVISASDTDLGLIGQCYLTFKLGNKYFTDKVHCSP